MFMIAVNHFLAAVIPEKPVKVERAQDHFHRDDEKIPLQVEPHV